MPISNDPQLIDELLTRGVERVYPSVEALREVLLSGKKLRIYNGIDPTGALHLGHSVSLLKLAEFQKLGHEAIMLLGGFTAMIGDPTDKMAARQPLTMQQVKANGKNYKKEVSAILDIRKTKVKDNAAWLSKLTFEDVIKLASNFTVQQMLERDMFEKRLEEGKPIHLHEFFYPLMQGYDSVAMDVDVEIGGNDQTFNMLAGRDLLKTLKGKEKFVITMKLLEDPVTGKKMSKTEGNSVPLGLSASDAFGRIMSWPDELILIAFELLTRVAQEQIATYKDLLGTGANPKDIKLKLAHEITRIYHGQKKADQAQEQFTAVFAQGLKPTDMPTVEAAPTLLDTLVAAQLVSSKSEARRLLQQNGIKVNDHIVTDEATRLNSGDIIQKGKRHFVKIK